MKPEPHSTLHMTDKAVELAMLQTAPEIQLEELDILWVLRRDSIAREGVLRWAGKTCYFVDRPGQKSYPASYNFYELTAEEENREYETELRYYDMVDENSRYAANLRVTGGKTHGSSTSLAFYNLLDGLAKFRKYTNRPIVGWFRGTL